MALQRGITQVEAWHRDDGKGCSSVLAMNEELDAEPSSFFLLLWRTQRPVLQL